MPAISSHNVTCQAPSSRRCNPRARISSNTPTAEPARCESSSAGRGRNRSSAARCDVTPGVAPESSNSVPAPKTSTAMTRGTTRSSDWRAHFNAPASRLRCRPASSVEKSSSASPKGNA